MRPAWFLFSFVFNLNTNFHSINFENRKPRWQFCNWIESEIETKLALHILGNFGWFRREDLSSHKNVFPTNYNKLPTQLHLSVIKNRSIGPVNLRNLTDLSPFVVLNKLNKGQGLEVNLLICSINDLQFIPSYFPNFIFIMHLI